MINKSVLALFINTIIFLYHVCLIGLFTRCNPCVSNKSFFIILWVYIGLAIFTNIIAIILILTRHFNKRVASCISFITYTVCYLCLYFVGVELLFHYDLIAKSMIFIILPEMFLLTLLLIILAIISLHKFMTELLRKSDDLQILFSPIETIDNFSGGSSESSSSDSSIDLI